VNDSIEAHYDLIRQHPYSRFPVCQGDLDRILGIVTVRDLWMAEEAVGRGTPIDLRAIVRQPRFVAERSPALDVLEQFQSSGTHIAIVIDEHGGVDGLLTLNNLLSFLVAPPAGTPSTHQEPSVVQRAEGSWLVDGALSLGDFYSAIGMDDPDDDRTRGYHTVAGLVMDLLGRIPRAGDRADNGHLMFDVADMDGFRVDKVLVTRRSVAGAGEDHNP
jgi:putative hemolysin